MLTPCVISLAEKEALNCESVTACLLQPMYHHLSHERKVYYFVVLSNHHATYL
jgi:excinuclease UvrABC nuclease subunit